MNSKKYLFLSLNILWVLTSYAQITTGEIEVGKKPVEEVPKMYDGFSDFALQKRDIDYKQYIGQQVYFPADENYGFLGTEPNPIVNGPIYLTIKDVLYGEAKKQLIKRYMFNNGLGPRDNDFESVDYPVFLLKKEGASENYYYQIKNDPDEFILVSYFLKQKEIYEKKKYVIVSSAGSFEDKSRNEQVNFEKPLFGGLWTCKVVMLKTKIYNHYYIVNGIDGPEISSQEMFYVISDSLGHTIKSYARNGEYGKTISFVKKLDDNKYYSSSVYVSGNTYRNSTYFIEVNDYNLELSRIQEEKQATSNAAKAIHKNDMLKDEKRLSDLKIKYGKENGTLIFNGKVKIGMTKQMCIAALGTPFNFKITKTKSLNKEVYYYGIDLIHEILYFENDYLVKISNTINLN